MNMIPYCILQFVFEDAFSFVAVIQWEEARSLAYACEAVFAPQKLVAYAYEAVFAPQKLVAYAYEAVFAPQKLVAYACEAVFAPQKLVGGTRVFMLSVLASAIAPGIALMAYFYLKDRYESEPIRTVIRMFIMGGLLVFPTMVLQRAFVLSFGENPVLYSFVYSSFLEEFLKWFLILFFIYKHEAFNEPYDGIVYAVAVSLGFATVENVIYSLLVSPSVSALLMRALLPVSGHALFGVMMGYHMGRARFNPHLQRKHLITSLFLPIFYHGLFDFILLDTKQIWMVFMVPLMVFLWYRSIRKVNRANANSPLRGIIREDEVKIS